MKKLGDADVEASLLHVAAQRKAKENDPDATLTVDPATVASPRFRILRPHAEGGLGQVFVAKDEELNREVALKEIKFSCSDDPDSRSRFVLEAEITGGLEHPGIVPVYGLGQYADGRPFYAMRFIRGDSLKEAIARFHKVGQASRPPNETPLPPGAGAGRTPASERFPKQAPSYDSLAFRNLLGRFIDVCNAIEYAHSRGVLHRDLKPGNIMLGKYGETLVVDWGLAKAKERSEQHQQSDENTLQPRSASGSSATQMGSAIGTPAYMSPEQAAGRLDQLGPASDVYSLGATLYSALTGQLAFSKGDTGEVLRRVEAGDFSHPRQICPSIPQQLEAICLRAMALRPSDRYTSPQALSDDLERYLADEPVRALSEPVTFRARRWLRKHPRLVASIAATLLVAITGSLLIASITANHNRLLAIAYEAEREAKNEADAKRTEAEHARQRAETAEALAVSNEGKAKIERDRAESERQIAQAVKDFLENRLLAQSSPWQQADALLREVGSSVSVKENPTIRELLDRAAAELTPEKIETQFPRMPLVQAEILNTIGSAYRSIGEYGQAVAHLERSRDTYHGNIGPDHPDTLATLKNLALAYESAGRTADAISLYQQINDKQIETLGPDHPATLATLRGLALAYRSAGRPSEAISLHEQVRDRQIERLGPDHPATLATLMSLALAYHDAGRTVDAISLYQHVRDKQIEKLGPDHPATLVTLHNLALAYESAGRTADAISLYQQINDKQIETLGPDHPATLMTLYGLAVAYRSAGRTAEAISLYQQVRDSQIAKLGTDHPSTLNTLNGLAVAYRIAGRTADAISLHEQVRDRQIEKLGTNHPDALATLHGLAVAYRSAGRTAEAISLYQQVRDRQIAKLGPDHPNTLTTLYNLAVAYRIAGRTAEAISLYQQVRDSQIAKLGTDHPSTLNTLNGLAVAYQSAGRTADAISLFEIVRDKRIGKLGPDHPQSIATLNTIARILATCPDERYRNGQQAIVHATKACELTHWKNAAYLDTLAAAYAESGDFEKAIEWQEKAIGIVRTSQLRARLELYKSGKRYRQPPPSPPSTNTAAPTDPATPPAK